MGGMVDGVVREQLREGHRLRVMGDGGGGRPIRPRRAGAEIFMVASLRALRLASVESLWKESYGVKKSCFPPKVGNIPADVGKNPCLKNWTINVGTVVGRILLFLALEHRYLCENKKLLSGHILFLQI